MQTDMVDESIFFRNDLFTRFFHWVLKQSEQQLEHLIMFDHR